MHINSPPYPYTLAAVWMHHDTNVAPYVLEMQVHSVTKS